MGLLQKELARDEIRDVVTCKDFGGSQLYNVGMHLGKNQQLTVRYTDVKKAQSAVVGCLNKCRRENTKGLFTIRRWSDQYGIEFVTVDKPETMDITKYIAQYAVASKNDYCPDWYFDATQDEAAKKVERLMKADVARLRAIGKSDESIAKELNITGEELEKVMIQTLPQKQLIVCHAPEVSEEKKKSKLQIEMDLAEAAANDERTFEECLTDTGIIFRDRKSVV